MHKTSSNFCPKEVLKTRDRYMELILETKNAREEWDATAIEAIKRSTAFKEILAIYRAAPISKRYCWGGAIARECAIKKMAELVVTIDDILEYLKYGELNDSVLKKWTELSLIEIRQSSSAREAKTALKRAPSIDRDIYREGFAKVLFFCTTRSKVERLLGGLQWCDFGNSSLGILQMYKEKVIQLIYQISSIKEIVGILNHAGWVTSGEESGEFWEKAAIRVAELCQSKNDVDSFWERCPMPYEWKYLFDEKEKECSVRKE